MSDKVVPIRGAWLTPQSLLAAVSRDPGVRKCIVIVEDENGDWRKTHFEMSRRDIAYASIVCGRWCQDED
jgi:hypothetical protein